MAELSVKKIINKKSLARSHVKSRWVLDENEFIVYNSDQVRIRYLI